MSEPIEEELRIAFAAKVDSVSPAVGQRLRAVTYSPRRGRPVLLARIGALGTSLAAAVVAAVLLLSSGTTAAFAGWTAVPATPSAAATKAARAACGLVTSREVLASDQRGPYTAIVYERGGEPTECITKGREVLLHQATTYPPRMFASPGAGNVTLPAPNSQWWRQDRVTAVSGTLGPGVTGITLRLTDGRQVRATVGHGWYLAWWPGSDIHPVYPTSIEVRTATGTHRAPYSAAELRELFVVCGLDGQCFKFMRRYGGFISLTPGVPSVLIKHFKLLRTVPPVPPGSVPRDLLSRQEVEAMGLDLAQTRIVKFGHRGSILVVPGTAALCLARVVKNGGVSACQKTSIAWRHGTIDSGSGGGPNDGDITYNVIAVVPDGYRSVAVHLSNGKTIVIRVKENVAFRTFKVLPTRLTLKKTA
jgi:hypothetical protein